MLIVKRLGGVTHEKLRVKFQFFGLTSIILLYLWFGLWWIHDASLSATAQLRGTTVVLGTLASQMQPGTWAELNTIGFGMALLSPPGCTPIDYITQYADSAGWDPQAKRFLFFGVTHGTCVQGRLIVYTDSNNTWTVGPPPPPCPGGSCPLDHAHDHNTVDPTTGDLYWRLSNTASIYKLSAASGSWSQLPDPPLDVVRLYSTCCGGLEYYPEMGGLVVVAGGFGEVAFFNKQTNQWSQLATGLQMGSYTNFIEYNPVHKVVIFGGGATSDIYKLDASGKIARMKNAPVALGIQRSLVSVDPVSGKYLVLSDTGRFYEYDITADSWRTLNLPPFWGSGFVGTGQIDGVIEAPVSTYGVVMYVVYNYGQSKVYLYKHAGGGKKT